MKAIAYIKKTDTVKYRMFYGMNSEGVRGSFRRGVPVKDVEIRSDEIRPPFVLITIVLKFSMNPN